MKSTLVRLEYGAVKMSENDLGSIFSQAVCLNTEKPLILSIWLPVAVTSTRESDCEPWR